MFEVLLASGAHPDVKAPWLTTSVVTHALVIALAVVTTRAALDAPRVASPDDVTFLFVPKPPEPPPPAIKPENPVPILTLAEPPPRGFQTVVAPSDIPTVIPPIELNQPPLDPRDFTGRGVEGGVAAGVVGGTGPVAHDAIYEAATNLPGFEPAVVLSQPIPQYPAALASVGVEGRVTVEFVIDTMGQVEPISVKVSESSHQAFELAARRAMTGWKFRPAHLGPIAVRQLTRQSVRFVAAH